VLLREGKLHEAEELVESTLALRKSLYGHENIRVAFSIKILGDIKYAQRQYQQAKSQYEEAVGIYTRVFGEQHFDLATLRTALADTYLKLDRVEDAEREARLSLKTLRAILPPDHQYIASAEYFLGLTLLRRGQYEEAKVLLEDSRHIWEKSEAPTWRIARSENALAEAMMKLGDRGDAAAALKNSLDVLTRDLGPSDPTTEEAAERTQRLLGLPKKTLSASALSSKRE
jgi:tetratricopeptide (TPR) repeat protein